MTRTSEGLAAFVVDQLEELYRRMWVLRLLDMALEQLRIEGLINGPLQGGFGQEAVSVGAAAALGEGDVIITTHRPHAQHVGTDAPLGPVIADMLGATAGDLEGADEDAHIADPRAGLPAAIRVVKQSPLLAIGHAYALWLRDTGRVTLCVTQDCDVDADAFNEAADLASRVATSGGDSRRKHSWCPKCAPGQVHARASGLSPGCGLRNAGGIGGRQRRRSGP